MIAIVAIAPPRNSLRGRQAYEPRVCIGTFFGRKKIRTRTSDENSGARLSALGCRLSRERDPKFQNVSREKPAESAATSANPPLTVSLATFRKSPCAGARLAITTTLRRAPHASASGKAPPDRGSPLFSNFGGESQETARSPRRCTRPRRSTRRAGGIGPSFLPNAARNTGLLTAPRVGASHKE